MTMIDWFGRSLIIGFLKRIKKMSKFKFKDKRPLREKIKDFLQSLLFWRGRRIGVIHTRNIEWDDIRAVFFPKDFYEKYNYLGAIPWKTDTDLFRAMEPLIVFMDAKARPWWCPRWFLRFLNLFGNDNSIVRVRNLFLHNLFNRITKGVRIYDVKTKWQSYDLRISIAGTDQMWDLAQMIEYHFYRAGYREEMEDKLSRIPSVNIEYNLKHLTYNELEKLYEEYVLNKEIKIIR